MKLTLIKNFLCAGMLFLGLFFANASVFARDLDVGKLHIKYDGEGALFNETNITPGFETVKTLTITNSGRVPHSFSIAVSGQLGGLADVLQIEPRNIKTGAPIWNQTLSKIAKSPHSSVILGFIDPGEVRQVNIAAILPDRVGNEYQNSTTFSFDFMVGSENTDQSESESQNSSINRKKPIDLKNIFALERFSKPEKMANENNNSQTGTKINSSLSTDGQGKVEGTSKTGKEECFWWWILLIILAVLLVLYRILFKKYKGWYFLFWPAFFGAFIYVIHWILHDYYSPSRWCGWWFGAILIFEVVVYYISLRFRGRSTE